jgi:hypothetical protein
MESSFCRVLGVRRYHRSTPQHAPGYGALPSAVILCTFYLKIYLCVFHHRPYEYIALLQVSLVWRSILDIGNLKTRLTLGQNGDEREAQVFALNELVPKLDLSRRSTLAENNRFCIYMNTLFALAQLWNEIVSCLCMVLIMPTPQPNTRACTRRRMHAQTENCKTMYWVSLLRCAGCFRSCSS